MLSREIRYAVNSPEHHERMFGDVLLGAERRYVLDGERDELSLPTVLMALWELRGTHEVRMLPAFWIEGGREIHDMSGCEIFAGPISGLDYKDNGQRCGPHDGFKKREAVRIRFDYLAGLTGIPAAFEPGDTPETRAWVYEVVTILAARFVLARSAP